MSTTTPQKIGFIGLGVMGTPMAGHLLAAGHTLFVQHAWQARRSSPFASKATVCQDRHRGRKARPTSSS